MEVIDLTNEACPINLVKFKYHFYRLQSLKTLEKASFIIKNGEPLNGIIKFLEYKKMSFELESKEGQSVILVKF